MGDQINPSGDHAIGKIVVGPASPRPEPPPRRVVLLLMSNPTDTARLRLDEEHRAIDQAIVGARFRDQLDLRVGPAPRSRELPELLSRHRPAVVHYAGHSDANGLAFLDDSGRAQRVDPTALEGLFGIIGSSVRCVVLNACLTDRQAAAIAAHVPCVVGMSGSVLDAVAVEFAAGFYRAIADGESVAKAFGFGRSRLALPGMNANDPVLIATPGVAERTFVTG